MSVRQDASPLVPFEMAAIAQSDRGRRVKQRDYLAEGRIPVIDQGQSRVGGYTNGDDFAFVGELPVVLFGDHTRAVKLVEHQFAVGAEGVKIFRPAEGVRAKYLYYWMQSAPLPDRGYGRHYKFLRQLSLPLPPPKRQDEIVAEFEKQFSRLDEAVANLKRVKANLARQRAAVLNAAVLGRLTAEREHPWPRSLDAGDPLPNGWRWRPAEDLAASDQGSIGAGPFGTIFKAKDFRSEGVPIIFLRHVAPMRYLQDKPGFMDARKWEELFRPYSVFGGELLITKLGEPPGVCALYPAGIGPAMVTPDVIKMRVNQDIAAPAYLMYYFNCEVAKRFATGAAFGTTRTRLTLPLFRAMPVVVPPREEQERIVAEVDRRLSIVCEVEAEVDANLARSLGLRRSVLARAFAPKGAFDASV